MSRRHRSGPVYDELIKKPCSSCRAKAGQACRQERPCVSRLKKIDKNAQPR